MTTTTTSSFDNDCTPIVLDSGSALIKIGYAGEDVPRSVFPNRIGRLRDGCSLPEESQQTDIFLGDDALANKEILTITCPMFDGIVTNWDGMEEIWRYAFQGKLGISPSEHPVLISEPLFNSRTNREKATEILFENFNVPAMYLLNQSRLSMYNITHTTGLVLEIGEVWTHTVPIYKDEIVSHAINRLKYGGRNLTDHMTQLLTEAGYNLSILNVDREIVQDIKEKLCYVALDYEQELTTAYCTKIIKQNYKLPNGEEITIGNERFQCAETLFGQGLMDRENQGIVKLIYDSVMKCPINQRRDIRKNIVLTGGTSHIPGLADRIHKELMALLPAGETIQIHSSSEHTFDPWTGASILASSSAFKTKWILRKEYDESGPSIVHRKCIQY